MARPFPGCAVWAQDGESLTLNEEFSSAEFQAYTYEKAPTRTGVILLRGPSGRQLPVKWTEAAVSANGPSLTPPTPPIVPRQVPSPTAPAQPSQALGTNTAQEVKYGERAAWYAPRVSGVENNYGVAVSPALPAVSESFLTWESYPNDDAVRSNQWRRVGQWPGMRAGANSGGVDEGGAASGFGTSAGSGDDGGVELPPGTAHYLARDRGGQDYNVLLRRRLQVAAAADHSGWSLMDVKLPFGWAADSARAEERFVAQQMRAADPRKQNYYGESSQLKAVCSSVESEVGQAVLNGQQLSDFFADDRAVMYERA